VTSPAAIELDLSRNISLLQNQAVGTNGRAFILDRTGKKIVSSAPDGDPVVQSAVAPLAQHTAPSGLPKAAIEFQFDHITSRRSRSLGKLG
jgi:hypothetical protein